MKPLWSRQRQRRMRHTSPLAPYQPPRRLPLGRIVAAIGGGPVVGPIPEWGEAILDGMRFKVDLVHDSGLDTFMGQVNFGEVSRSSDPLLSTWIISDLSGGHGLININEGTDLNRYRFGTLYVRHPNQITLPRKAQEFDQASFSAGLLLNAFVLGDHFDGTDFDLYAWVGGDIYVFNEASDTWTLDSNSNGTVFPKKPGVAFRGTGSTTKLFVPGGSEGYFTYNGGTYNEDTETFVDFCLWDDKLIGLDTTGQLQFITDAAAAAVDPTWTSYGTTGKLDASYVPQRLVVYRDRSDAPCVHVVTDRDVWAFDPAGPSLYRIEDLSFPPRPFANGGLHRDVPACVWRGDLYVAAGMGVYRYNGATVTAVGLDRDDGLPIPSDWNNRIEWLWPEHNGLYALTTAENPDDNGDGENRLGLHVFTGFGWHLEWEAFVHGEEGSTTNPAQATWGITSFDGNGYRLWWGASNKHDNSFGVGDTRASLYSFELPRDFANPRQLVTDSTGKFAIGGLYYLHSGRFDAGMRGYAKIANGLHVTIAEESTMADVWLQLFYRIDGEETYRALGTVSHVGKTTLLFGATDAHGVRPGVEFDDIEFLVEAMKSSDETTSFIIEDCVLSFQRVRERSESFLMTLDLTATHADQSPEAMMAKLRTLRGGPGEPKRFFAMSYRQTSGGIETFRGRISQMSAKTSHGTGRDTRCTVDISFVEIPESLGAA